MNKRVLTILAVILVVFVVAFVFKGSDFLSDQNISLTTSYQPSYQSGEEVRFDIRLNNAGDSSVCLSREAIGNVRFDSFTRDGQEVASRTVPSYFLTSFSEIIKSRLTSVAPGEVLEFVLTSSFDPGLGVEALSITKPDGTSGIATFYNVQEPGEYEATLVYEYVVEPSDDCKDVLRGSISAPAITFTVE